jgi:hypothetical protein
MVAKLTQVLEPRNSPDKSGRIRRGLSIVAICLLSPPAHTLLADECIDVGPRRALRFADIVFLGKVTAVENLMPFDPIETTTGKLALERAENGSPYVATFAVTKIWKGAVGTTAQVFAFARPGMGYGFQFRVGSQYVVYAFDDINQAAEHFARFSKRSRVYNLGFPCRSRVATDIAAESRSLGAARVPSRQP